jgi:DNA-binding MarR family transcriptional regulator
VDSVSEAAFEIRGGATRLAHRLRTERAAGALSANKVSVLTYLYRHGPSTPGQLATAERQHPQSLTRVFAELEGRGFVTRSRSTSDGRQSVLEITAPGRQALASDMADRDRWLAHALADLTEMEVHVLRTAAALMDRLAEAAAAPDGS